MSKYQISLWWFDGRLGLLLTFPGLCHFTPPFSPPSSSYFLQSCGYHQLYPWVWSCRSLDGLFAHFFDWHFAEACLSPRPTPACWPAAPWLYSWAVNCWLPYSLFGTELTTSEIASLDSRIPSIERTSISALFNPHWDF